MAKPIKKTDQKRPWNLANKRHTPNRRPERFYFLLVSEGNTESLYFRAFASTLPQELIHVTAFGTGFNTLSIVNEVAAIKRRKETELGLQFDHVWVIFDKDSFLGDYFDNAIYSCAGRKKLYGVAWSNECFELWYLLHFKDQKTGLGRQAIYRALEKGLGIVGYEKLKGEAGRTVHERMALHANQATAIVRAKKLYADWNDPHVQRTPPSQQNPCTTVFLLVEKLLACRQAEK